RGARTEGAEVLHGALESVSELSPAVRVCHSGIWQTRQKEARLPSRELPDTLREADLDYRLAAVFETGDQREDVAAAGHANQRHRSRQGNAEGQASHAGRVPNETMKTVQSSSSQGFCSAEQGKGTQTPSPCPAPHPLLYRL